MSELRLISIQYVTPKPFAVVGAGPVDECDTFEEAQEIAQSRDGAAIYHLLQEFAPCDPEIMKSFDAHR